jgi:hypothetical protein
MVSWRLLCTRVASAIAAKGLSRGGLTQSGFRWAVRPPGSDDERFEYDTCVALHTWHADAQAGKKTALFEPFIYKNQHFTKTDSGRT